MPPMQTSSSTEGGHPNSSFLVDLNNRVLDNDHTDNDGDNILFNEADLELILRAVNYMDYSLQCMDDEQAEGDGINDIDPEQLNRISKRIDKVSNMGVVKED